MQYSQQAALHLPIPCYIDVSTSHLQTSALSSMQWLNYRYYIYWGLIWWVARPGHDLYPSSHLRISSLWFRILFILMTRGARLLIHASGLQVRRGKQKKCERVLENIPPISNYWVFISNVERKSKRGGLNRQQFFCHHPSLTVLTPICINKIKHVHAGIYHIKLEKLE